MSLWELYWVFCKIGAITFGGGYAMLPLFQDELVNRTALLTPAEFANMAALAQLTPGAIGMNMATYIGYNQAGLAGALTLTAGLLTPPLFIVTVIAYFFAHFSASPWVKAVLSGIHPAMLGLIGAAVVFFLEISVFTAPVPWGAWWRALGGGAATGAAGDVPAFGVEPGGLVIFAVALALGIWGRYGVPVIILVCAALGAAGHWLG